MLNIGLSSRVLSHMTVAEAAAFMQKEGFRCTELCFTHPELSGWLYNGIGSLENITPQKVKESADIFRARGVDVTSLGLYTDLRNPDSARRAETLDYCRRYIELAAAADIPYIATQCGFTPGHRGVNADSYEADYASVRDGLQQICLEAEQSGVHMVLEACMLDIIPSPRRLKTLIEELEATSHVRLGALIDPSNFIANSDEEGMFCYLKHDVAYCHGKDRKLNSVCACMLGEGDVDWIKFMECYIRFADKKPFILEDCPVEKCAELKKRAEDYYDAAFRTIISRIY